MDRAVARDLATYRIMKLTPELVFNYFSHAVIVSYFDRFNLCEGDTLGLLCAHWMISDRASTNAALNLGSVYLQLGVSACSAFLSSLSGIEH